MGVGGPGHGVAQRRARERVRRKRQVHVVVRREAPEDLRPPDAGGVRVLRRPRQREEREELGAPVPPRGLKLHRQRGELAEGVEGAELRAPRVGPEPPEDSTTEPLFLRRLYSVVVEKRVTTRKKRMRLRRKYFVERVLSQNVWVMKVEDTTTSILNHARTSTFQRLPFFAERAVSATST